MKLYTEVTSREEKSDFIKDAIEFYLDHIQKKEKDKPSEKG